MTPDQKALLEVLERFALPLAVALISWFVKDYLVGTFAKREEVVRAEWTYRLREVWSPMFYWSGIVMFKSAGRGWDRHGTRELEALLAQSAHLLPQEHYATLLELLEVRSRDGGLQIALERVQRARSYIYKQVEIYNYLLFRKVGWFSPVERTDLFSTIRGIVRLLSQAIFHVAVWMALCAMFGLVFWAYIAEFYWVMVGIAAVLLGVSGWDAKQRWSVYQEVRKATGVPRP